MIASNIALQTLKVLVFSHKIIRGYFKEKSELAVGEKIKELCRPIAPQFKELARNKLDLVSGGQLTACLECDSHGNCKQVWGDC